ncbi:hypothetical protein FRC08_001015 [Ceratobasidium sp. 394]|nr:hypothetical protein FRC08_001015 [Ceratobasidium sp. 394]
MSWETLTSISMLADFDLLHGSRTGVLEEEWAQPSNRRAAEEYQYVMRAKEEILRLNIEVRRVHTSISDERRELPELAKRVGAQSPELQWVVNRYVERRLKVNDRIMCDLNALMRSNQYTGSPDTGVRVGSQPDREIAQPPLPSVPSELLAIPVDETDTPHDAADAEAGDEACNMFDAVQAVLEKLSM